MSWLWRDDSKSLRRDVLVLNNPAESVERRNLACRSLRETFQLRRQESGFQDKACSLGVVDGLLRFLCDHPTAECAPEAFWCLGVLAFRHSVAATTLGQHPLFPRAVTTALTHPSQWPALKKQAVYPCQNATSFSFASHKPLMCVVPVLLRMLEEPKEDPDFKRECLIVLNNIAYNEDSRAEMLALGALGPLLRVVQSCDLRLAYPLAAIGVANLTTPASSDHAAGSNALACLTPEDTAALVRHVNGFLQAALGGRDYPERSGMFPCDWKIAMTTAALASNPANVDAMVRQGTVGLLRAALAQEGADARVVKFALLALWRLSAGR